MKGVLEARNRALVRDLNHLSAVLTSAKIPESLIAYRTRILDFCDGIRGRVEQNLGDLALGRPEILEDILSNTQEIVKLARLLSTRMASPILRALREDHLSLAIINWLHREHAITAGLPGSVADGECAIWPFLRVSPVYFFPCLEQRGLLFQPLFFHEFGHLLYASHKLEMDDLVRELQRQVAEILAPSSQRNDRYADLQVAKRQVIVDRWYRWTQEFFCDLVGLQIGGPSFLFAFARYMGSLERGDFYRQSTDLEKSSHPVPWLRIKLLVERARESGYQEIAEQVFQEWQELAQTMGVQEDYHGFYDEAIHPILMATINDMLIEANPRPCTREEVNSQGTQDNGTSLIAILNQAWHVYLSEPEKYAAWESSAQARIIGTDVRFPTPSALRGTDYDSSIAVWSAQPN